MQDIAGVFFFLFFVLPILTVFNIIWEAANKPQSPPTVNISMPPPAPLQPPSPQGPFDLIRDMQGMVRAERIDKIERFDNGRFRAERHDIIEGYSRGSIYLANVPYENIRQTAQAVYEERMRNGTPGDASSDWREAEERIVQQMWRQAHPINCGVPAPPTKEMKKKMRKEQKEEQERQDELERRRYWAERAERKRQRTC